MGSGGGGPFWDHDGILLYVFYIFSIKNMRVIKQIFVVDFLPRGSFVLPSWGWEGGRGAFWNHFRNVLYIFSIISIWFVHNLIYSYVSLKACIIYLFIIYLLFIYSRRRQSLGGLWRLNNLWDGPYISINILGPGPSQHSQASGPKDRVPGSSMGVLALSFRFFNEKLLFRSR